MNQSRRLQPPSPLFQYAPVGARVLSGYWQEVYTVTSHNTDGTVTVQWEDGKVTTHRTAFEHPRYIGDKRADQILNHMELLATG